MYMYGTAELASLKLSELGTYGRFPVDDAGDQHAMPCNAIETVNQALVCTVVFTVVPC
jgi:hypothetical protein